MPGAHGACLSGKRCCKRTKGAPNWFHILLCLADGDQHGYAIMREVLERTDGKVKLWPATLYVALRRLVDAGLIEESGGQPATDDMRRRFYRLTSEGRTVVASEIRRLEALLRAARAKGRSLKTEPALARCAP